MLSTLDTYNLVDVWRVLNPAVRRYTWRQNSPFVQSRIDYFLVSAELLYDIVKCEIKPSIKTDHSILNISIKLHNEQRRGPGFWKLNVNILRDAVYLDMIREKLWQLKQEYTDIQDDRLKWDLIKSDIRQLTIDYSKTQAYIKRAAEKELLEQLNEESLKLEKHPDRDLEIRVDTIRDKLEQINSEKARGAFIRSKAIQIEEDEHGSSYFINMEKRNYKMKYIKKLNISETESITDPKKILEEEVKFYSALYSSDNNLKETDSDFFNDKIPKISEHSRNLCDQEITLEECNTALKNLKNGKSPGSDGFPPEFYKIFWQDIRDLVFNSISKAQKAGELSIEQKRGILKLILKKDKIHGFYKIGVQYHS